ncbi:MAG: PEP-utilizing enzyme [Vicinamibacteria bacterium]|nr:PEP-utilizing enzyme [Vicinamibacteria bacterium]
MPLVLPLARVGLADAPRVGAKAARLGELRAAGFPVPDGLCVTADACRAQLKASGLDLGDAPALRAHLARAPLDPGLAAALRTALQPYEGRRLAVRSSALAEDLAGASFAGQHDTFLDVAGADAVIDALRGCWASLFEERAVSYRRRNPVAAADLALACLIQEMVPARHAGVAFTADPRTGRRDRAVVEAVAGLGESLVSGAASADGFTFDTATGALLEARVVSADPPPEAVVREAYALAARVAALFATPQDVEWAAVDGAVHLLQSRPITALPPQPISLAQARRPILLYPVRVREMITSPLTPLTEDVALRVIVPRVARQLQHHGLAPELADRDVETMLRRNAGRFYLDLTRVRDLLLPGLDELGVAAVLEHGAHPPLRALSLAPLWALGWRAFTIPVRLLRSLGQLAALSQRSEAELDRLLSPLEAEAIDGWADARLARLVAELEPVPGFTAALVASAPANAIARGAGAPLVTALGKLLERWCGQPRDAVATLIAGGAELSEVQCAEALWVLSREARAVPELESALRAGAAWPVIRALPAAGAWCRNFEAFLRRFGHRAIEEVELARPRFREWPEYPLSIVANYLDADPEREPRRIAARRIEARDALAARVRARLRFHPLRRLVFGFLWRAGRAVGQASENTKFHIVRVLDLMRRAALEWGARRVAEGRLGHAADVFFLRLDELRPGDGDLSDVAAKRRALHEEARRTPAPDVVDADGRPIAEWGERLHVADDGALRGIGSSPGLARGPVVIVHDPSGGQRLAPGSVLVAPYTDPAWTPLFLSAGAIVVEVGSVLSHASIVARELGVPSVVALAGATHLLRPGDWVEVDGTAGTVRKVAPGD